jgi:hypothetical protein
MEPSRSVPSLRFWRSEAKRSEPLPQIVFQPHGSTCHPCLPRRSSEDASTLKSSHMRCISSQSDGCHSCSGPFIGISLNSARAALALTIERWSASSEFDRRALCYSSCAMYCHIITSDALAWMCSSQRIHTRLARYLRSAPRPSASRRVSDSFPCAKLELQLPDAGDTLLIAFSTLDSPECKHERHLFESSWPASPIGRWQRTPLGLLPHAML